MLGLVKIARIPTQLWCKTLPDSTLVVPTRRPFTANRHALTNSQRLILVLITDHRVRHILLPPNEMF